MTPEEHAQVRASRITGTRVKKVMTGNSTTLNNLADTMRKAEPKLLGQGGTAALDWGVDHEDQAAYRFWEKHPEYQIADPKWCYWHDPQDRIHHDHCGYSTDRLLTYKHNGTALSVPLEIKCPFNPDIHQAYIKAGCVPEEYKYQVAWGMAVTNSDCAWFVSFDPREKSDEYGWFELCVKRDHAFEAQIIERVNRFLESYTMGDDFRPTTPTAQKYKEMFS